MGIMVRVVQEREEGMKELAWALEEMEDKVGQFKEYLRAG